MSDKQGGKAAKKIKKYVDENEVTASGILESVGSFFKSDDKKKKVNKKDPEKKPYESISKMLNRKYQR